MARKGLNTTLSYARGNTTSAIRLRTNIITYDVRQVAAESQGRTYRTFYPHRRTQAQFAIGILLKGYDEYETMNNWFGSYAKYALSKSYENAEWPRMNVAVPSRNFSRVGIPLGVFEWGDHVGSMMWTPLLVFETTKEPGDSAVNFSQFNDATSKLREPESAYYYPNGNQLNNNDAPIGDYVKAPPAFNVQTLQAVVNGSMTQSSADSFEDPSGTENSSLGSKIATGLTKGLSLLGRF
jgi:hypothetical protein